MEPARIILAQLREMARGFLEMLPQIGLAAVCIVLTVLLAKGAQYVARKALIRFRLRTSLVALGVTVAKIGVWIIGLLIATMIVFPSVTPGRLFAALGLGSIAIGFAFKDIFENFLAGIMILFREPFRLNDLIEVEDIEGRVEEISIRETHVRQTDGQRVVIPNAVLFKNPVTIRTDQDLRRTSLVCGVGYGEDVKTCRDIIRKAVEDAESVNNLKKPVEVYAGEFADSSINFTVRWWTGPSPVDQLTSRDEVVEAIKRALDDNDIEIPFPHRTLTFNAAVPVAQKGDAETELDSGKSG